VRTRFVTHGTAQAEDADTLVNEDLVFDTNASFRRIFLILPVMVSVYVQHWHGGKRHQERKIERVQIAAGDNQVDSLQLAFFKKVP